jgi:hypothetical protein
MKREGHSARPGGELACCDTGHKRRMLANSRSTKGRHYNPAAAEVLIALLEHE